jgi:ABC-type polysaccharide/polyol phosphate export permease
MSFTNPSSGGIWAQRWLFFSLFEREVKNRYAGSGGGLLWSLAHPLLLLGVYALVFGTIFRVSFPELGRHLFIEFVAFGLWPWLAFQESVQRATLCIQGNASLVRKVAFRHELLVLSTVAATFAIHMAGFVLVLVALSLFGHGFSPAGLLPAALLLGLLGLLALGFSLVLSAFQVFLRDLEQFMGPMFMVLFYATPILYPQSLLPEWAQSTMQFNPLTHFIVPIRESLLHGALPSISVATWVLWGLTAPFAALCLAVFRQLSPYFEDAL